ncbi:riboflavin synthase [Desulforegula conservatrix]|uniref:riboflavin synthase n=1 Tax=Desulforegula conservatrix TaxID=153026 RepID=UPI00041806ED|nr:riboflavin synthase [Desulforegula conservatrix]
MFTGIIEGFGTIREVHASGAAKRMSIEADFDLDGVRIGDSISVSGTCLTAVTLEGRRFTADVAPETLSRSTHNEARAGARVNLERALRLGARLDGHIVSGHVDGTGIISSKLRHANAWIITIEIDPSISRYMIEKGSVAVDGISLTINRCSDRDFELSIIPHTAMLTTIGFKGVGDKVNIEVDIIGKYIEKLMFKPSSGGEGDKGKPSGIDVDFLAKNGFL